MQIEKILYLIISLLSVFGFSIVWRIIKEKHKDGPMVCPMGADCHVVVNSKFSKFFGIGIEYFGAVYYAFTILSYLALAFIPALNNLYVIFILTGITIGAFLFSLFLTFVQAFYLKSWCTWCLGSALITTLVFVVLMINIGISGISFNPIFIQFKPLIVAMHLLGFALGVGGATITDVLFMKFLKDFKISEAEDKILRIMSQVIWVGLALVVISGIGLYLPNMEALHESSKFLTKMVVVGIIIVNGSILNLFVSPKLVEMSFRDTGLNIIKTNRLRKVAFALGSVSFVSWYTAFVLGSLKSVPTTFLQTIGIYVAITLIAVLGSQIMERFISGKTYSTKEL